MRRQTSLLQAPVRRGTAGGSLTNRRCAARSRWLFSRRSRPSRLFLRQNGPEQSRARLFLARRSEPLTARTVLASAVSRRAALVGKQPFPLVSSEFFLTPPSRPPFRPSRACGAGTAGRTCPPPTDTPPASALPPEWPGCDSPAPPPARVPPPIADSTAALFSPPRSAPFANGRCAVSRSVPAVACRPMTPTQMSTRSNSRHEPPKRTAAGRLPPAPTSMPSPRPPRRYSSTGSPAGPAEDLFAASPAVAAASLRTSPSRLGSTAEGLLPIPALLPRSPAVP